MTGVLLSALYACQLQWLPFGLGLFFIACFRKSFQPIVAALLIYCIVNSDTVLLFLPKISVFSGLHWNWQGKILELFLALFIVYGLKRLTPHQVGLQLPQNKWVFLYVLILGILLMACIITLAVGLGEPLPARSSFSLETLLFQATMPGLAEEALFRGVYLAILNQYLGKQWSIFKVTYGWGMFLVTLLFVMVHLIRYSPVLHQMVYSFEMLDIVPIGIIGLSLAFIREQSASIWPAVLFHNVCNVSIYLLVLLIS